MKKKTFALFLVLVLALSTTVFARPLSGDLPVSECSHLGIDIWQNCIYEHENCCEESYMNTEPLGGCFRCGGFVE